MKAPVKWATLVAAAVLVAVWAWRGAPALPAQTGVETTPKDAPLDGRKPDPHRVPGTREHSRRASVTLSAEVLRQAASEVADDAQRIGPGLLARDQYFDKVLGNQQRDSPREDELATGLLDRFSAKPEVTVHDVACGAEFCRVGILVPPQPEASSKYARELLATLDPKGQTLFLEDTDDETSRVTCYFGREAGWTFQVTDPTLVGGSLR